MDERTGSFSNFFIIKLILKNLKSLNKVNFELYLKSNEKSVFNAVRIMLLLIN